MAVLVFDSRAVISSREWVSPVCDMVGLQGHKTRFYGYRGRYLAMSDKTLW